ncbi:phage holin family protein [Patescibacteria group bacterium]
MKKIIRFYVIDTFSLFLVNQIAGGLEFEQGYITLFLAGGALTLTSLLAKPVINLLLLPLNLVTFGVFRWVSSAIALYLVTLLVDGFKVVSFNFPGLATQWLDLPALNFNGFIAYIGFAFILSLASSILHWIFK